MDYFKRVGVELTDLRFEGIDTTPEYRERLFWLKTGQTAPGDVLRMETVKSCSSKPRTRRRQQEHSAQAWSSSHKS